MILTVIPLVGVTAYYTMYYNETKGKRASQSYKVASSVAYTSISGIRTVLSLNGVKEMIRRYRHATLEAFEYAKGFFVKIGLANGKSKPDLLSSVFFRF